MGIVDLFSKRQKRQREEVSDVYIYDTITSKLRTQIVHILNDCIGVTKGYYGSDDLAQDAYEYIFLALCREYGTFHLVDNIKSDYDHQVINFILQAKTTEEVLDVVEASFQYVNNTIRENYRKYEYETIVKLNPGQAIHELNERFRENGVGYSFEGNEIIRIDSTYIHAEITKPVIFLLGSKLFEGANEEYLKAHEHYRHVRNKECLNECLKAFESVIKIICKEKKWPFNQTDTARKLIQVCFQHNLVPTFIQNQFTSLQSLLESGIPTIRNKLGGHGQGQVPQKVDDEMTRYGLNLTGTNIIFLIEQSGLK